MKRLIDEVAPNCPQLHAVRRKSGLKELYTNFQCTSLARVRWERGGIRGLRDGNARFFCSGLTGSTGISPSADRKEKPVRRLASGQKKIERVSERITAHCCIVSVGGHEQNISTRKRAVVAGGGEQAR